VLNSRRLILAHFWLAFLVFGIALVLGAWQMFIRSPLHTWISDPEWYYRSVTAHGTIMGYVFPTLIAMGFGYAISESSLGQPLIGPRWAWADFGLVALHSDFDWLIIARSEFWQVGGVDGESDGSGDAGLSCDEAGFFER